MSNITLTAGTIEDITRALGRHLAPAIEDHGSICEIDYEIILEEDLGENSDA